MACLQSCARATLVDGDRVFLGSNEGGIRGKTPYVLDRFDLEYIRQFDFVHSGNYCFMEKELPKIREAGVSSKKEFFTFEFLHFFTNPNMHFRDPIIMQK